MKKSILLISLTFAMAACTSDAADKDKNAEGWTLGENNSSNNGQSNNGQNNGQNNGVTNNNGLNNGVTSGNNGVTSNNNGTTSNNNGTTSNNNGTSSNNATTGGGGLTTSQECNVNSECQNGLFCCPQGFQGGPGTCETSCQMTGGKCGGNHDECDQPTEGCCETIDICAEQCTQNPTGTVCTTNPDCSNGQQCCPNFGGGDATCADDCGSDRIGGICATDADCSGQTGKCCDLPIGADKLCLQQCGF